MFSFHAEEQSLTEAQLILLSSILPCAVHWHFQLQAEQADWEVVSKALSRFSVYSCICHNMHCDFSYAGPFLPWICSYRIQGRVVMPCVVMPQDICSLIKVLLSNAPKATFCAVLESLTFSLLRPHHTKTMWCLVLSCPNWKTTNCYCQHKHVVLHCSFLGNTSCCKWCIKIWWRTRPTVMVQNYFWYICFSIKSTIYNNANAIFLILG